MPARFISSVIIALVLICIFPASGWSADKRLITEKDIFKFVWVADPQISPDGSQVVFVKVVVNEKNNDYETSLWMVASNGNGESQRLTSGTRDASPRWSSDGSRLAFVRAVERDKQPQPAQIFILPMTGGEPWPLTTLPKGSRSPAWSPDGKKIAFVSGTLASDIEKSEKKGEGDAATKETTAERESDVRIITRAVYRSNGAGYVDAKRPPHIWVISVPSAPGEAPLPKPQLLTAGPYSEQAPLWASDGSQIYFTSNRTLEPYYEVPQDAIYSVPADGGEVKKVISINGDIGAVTLSPDGKRFAFRGVVNKPVQSYTQNDLWVSDVAPGSTAKNLTADFDYDIGSGVGGDQAPPRGGGGSRPIWSGNSIIELVGKQGTATLSRFDAQTGKVSPVTEGNQDTISFTASNDGSKLAMLGSTPTRIGDIYIAGFSSHLDTHKGLGLGIARVTHFNDKLFSELNLTEPEEIWYTSFDGKKIQAWVQKPPDFDSSKKYPLILNIHGGPHAAYGYTFDHEFQWMAAKGYVVLYPNPRGSTTYGQEFGNIIQYHYPGDDAKDLMAGVDELIKRSYIDSKRMGVTGGSGGGVLTNWLIGHTDRFAAAASQRSISDWADFWYTADFTLFQPSWFRAAPWQDPDDYKARSPITYVDKIKTPLMLIEGEADYRTPPTSGGEQLFRALKFLKRPVVMVRFPDESHELSRSGKPRHRVERLQNIVSWFDIYLQGKKLPGYEIAPGVEMQTGTEEE